MTTADERARRRVLAHELEVGEIYRTDPEQFAESHVTVHGRFELRDPELEDGWLRTQDVVEVVE